MNYESFRLYDSFPVWQQPNEPGVSRSVNASQIILIATGGPRSTELAESLGEVYCHLKDAANLALKTLRIEDPVHLVFLIGWDDPLEPKDTCQAIWGVIHILQEFAMFRGLHVSFFLNNVISKKSSKRLPQICWSPLIGVAQTLSNEMQNGSIVCHCLEDTALSKVKFQELLARHSGFPTLWSGRGCYEYRFKSISGNLQPASFRRGGTYLIVGGAGGLGSLFGKHLQDNYQARIVMLGRKDPKAVDPLITTRFSYIQANICSTQALMRVREHVGPIDGLFHSALSLDDCSWVRMKHENLRRVFDSKVLGTVNLLSIFEHSIRDFILVFSSVQSFIGNAGQMNYAAASRFQDAWSLSVPSPLQSKVKLMRWGFWGERGAVSQPFYTKRLNAQGIGSIQAEEGIKAAEAFLNSGLKEWITIKAAPEAIKRLKLEPEPLALNQDSVFDAIEESHSEALEIYLAQRVKSLTAILNRAPAEFSRLANTLLELAERYPVQPYPNPIVSGPMQRFADHCLDAYEEVFQGLKTGVEVLFPDGSFDWVKTVYAENSAANCFNACVAEIIQGIHLEFASSGKDNIFMLEIGSGTGATTRHVLEAISLERATYHASDISKAFIKRLKESYKNEPHFDAFFLDIERPSEALLQSRYDVILATNVLHATKNIDKTLNHCKAMLSPGGYLVVNEVHLVTLFSTVTFGLLKGWWLSKDKWREPNSPLLSPKAWKECAEQLGLTLIARYGNSEQSVMLFQKRYSEEKKGGLIMLSAENLCRTSIAQVMCMDAGVIEWERNFEEYGIDSLITLEIIKAISTQAGKLPSTLLFEYPNLKSLVGYLETEKAEYFTVKTSKHNSASFSYSKLHETSLELDDTLAITGMGFRLPEINGIQELWECFSSGAVILTDIPKIRWDLVTSEAVSYSGKGAFLSSIDHFDAPFFGISPHDAETLDPQARLLIETAYHAIEDAGLRLNELKESDTGVFVSCMNHGYSWLGKEAEPTSTHLSAPWAMANRISYAFDLMGPSVALDAACSGSLHALHVAAQALRNNECSAALVGAANLITHPRQLNLLSKFHMLSKKGRCTPFDEQADGFTPGEGVVVFVLKRYKDAISNKDHIYGLIRGTAVTAGGRAASYTAPNPNAQARAVIKAMHQGGVNPKDYTFIECHGTGTLLGDPLELKGIEKALGTGSRHLPIPVGSSKANFGHLEACAGFLGILRVLLQYRFAALAPQPRNISLSLAIDFEAAGVRVLTEIEPWARCPGQRITGVSSFGAGGSNAHVILQDIPVDTRANNFTHQSTFFISARSLPSFQNWIVKFKQYLMNDQPRLESIARTLAERQHFDYRLALNANTIESLMTQLEGPLHPSKVSSNEGIFSIDLEPEVQIEEYYRGLSPEKRVDCREKIAVPPYSFEAFSYWPGAKSHKNKVIDFNDDCLISGHRFCDRVLVPAAYYISHWIHLYPNSSLAQLTIVKQQDSVCTLDHMACNAGRIEWLNRGDQKLTAMGYVDTEVGVPLNLSGLIDMLKDAPFDPIDSNDFYDFCASGGFEYQDQFKCLREIRNFGHIVSAKIILPASSYSAEPGVIDCGLQLALLSGMSSQSKAIFMPLGIDSSHNFQESWSKEITVLLKNRKNRGKFFIYDLHYLNSDERVLLSLIGVYSVKQNIKTETLKPQELKA